MSKTSQIVLLIISIFLISCTKEKYSGKYDLGENTIKLLPTSDSTSYINIDSSKVQLIVTENYKYYQIDIWDTDDGGLGTVNYTGDFETRFIKYESEFIHVFCELFVDKHGELHQDILSLIYENRLSGENYKVAIEIPADYCLEMGYQSNLQFADSITINKHLLYDVYFVELNTVKFYLQEGKGLVTVDVEL